MWKATSGKKFIAALRRKRIRFVEVEADLLVFTPHGVRRLPIRRAQILAAETVAFFAPIAGLEPEDLK
jgi:hypothetical protein